MTDTGDNAVSVFNGATCNALVTSRCGQKPVTVPVGLAPLGMYADPANHTVYIADSNNGAGSGSTTVSMLDSATCNATGLAACPTQPPPTVDVGAEPNDVDVNLATHTVYVTTIGARNGWTVFNASTCNATVRSGCGAIGAVATAYVASGTENAVSVIPLTGEAQQAGNCRSASSTTCPPVSHMYTHPCASSRIGSE